MRNDCVTPAHKASYNRDMPPRAPSRMAYIMEPRALQPNDNIWARKLNQLSLILHGTDEQICASPQSVTHIDAAKQ